VRNTATITAAAAKITRPEWARPSTIASRASWLRSQCSFPECTRTVTDLVHRMIYLPQPEAGQHDSRALAVQALGHVVLDHHVPRDYAFLELEVDARTRDKGALHVQVPRSRLLVTAARGPGHPLGRTGVAQRPGAFTLAGRHAAWSVSWRRRHRSAEVLGTTRRSLRPPGGTPAAVVTAFGGDRCRVLRLARRPERLRPTR
jgi:hypothetical protein